MEIVTTSSETAFQSPLKAKRHLVQQKAPKTEGSAMVIDCFHTTLIQSSLYTN
jgi:hypothetical protein